MTAFRVFGLVCIMLGFIGFSSILGLIALASTTDLKLSQPPEYRAWVVLLVSGVLLFLQAKGLARLSVPVPKLECPECGYPATHASITRCSECGSPVRDVSA